MTDDQIIAAAARIKRRRLNEKRLASLSVCRGLMIRWDNPGAPFGEAYTSIEVATADVHEIVTQNLSALIAADAT